MSEQRLTAFSFAGDRSDARSRVRDILHYQLAYEAAERARQRLLVVLAALSAVLWLALARRSLVSEPVVATALTAWVVVFFAVLVALAIERHCRKRQDAALEEARTPQEEET